ncbi:MAG: alpha/beta hydrolase [Ectothiorhodospiraceae bacterium]|nr:alpha/beta hydrolase [Chromatiales bacterium]MCP5155946.1 alpha/beta hydrolase [Ectothiorhodospiraceae bacterium]
MTGFTERVAAMGDDSGLVGVLALPEARPGAEGGTCVIILGAGLVHHVGPNRLMVRLARRLAERGYPAIRFDHRGIGDSGPRRDDTSFEVGAIAECREVMDHMAANENCDQFVLLGLCSGADTALRVAAVDTRVVGAVMINGVGQGQGVDQAWDTYEYVRGQTRHYVRRSLFNLDSWWRALTGRIQYRRLFGILFRAVRDRLVPPKTVVSAAQQVAADIAGVMERGTRLLWVQSEGDASQTYLETMLGKSSQRLLASGRAELVVIPHNDHLLTARHGQQRLIELTEQWIASASSGARGEVGAHGAAR